MRQPVYHSDLLCMRDRYILVLYRSGPDRKGKDRHYRERDRTLVFCPREFCSHILLQHLDLKEKYQVDIVMVMQSI